MSSEERNEAIARGDSKQLKFLALVRHKGSPVSLYFKVGVGVGECSSTRAVRHINRQNIGPRRNGERHERSRWKSQYLL